MKKILSYTLAVVCAASAALASAPEARMTYRMQKPAVVGDEVRVSMTFHLDSLMLGTDRQIYLTPVLEGPAGEAVELPSVLVNGRNMHFAYLRGTLPGQKSGRRDVGKEIRRRNGTRQSFEYTASVPREAWMLSPEARIIVTSDTCGCGRTVGSGIGDPILLDLNPYRDMRAVFLTPEVSELPVSIHEGRARVQFEVDRTELHTSPYVCRNGQRIDNREQLRMIDDSVRLALSDPNVEIASVAVCGYASPESPYTHNEVLSAGRSRALAEYMAARYNLRPESSTYSSVAENWKEFREIVDTASVLTDTQRAALLELIDRPTYGPSDFDSKERELKNDRKFARLYRETILPLWFPKLRATTFAITTRLRPMSDEKLAEVMRQTPELMSLNQIMRVARLHPEGSAGFNEAIAVALRHYPDDPVANLNAAIAAIGENDIETADLLLRKAGDSPQAENARGITATMRGDFDTARKHFTNASVLPEAAANLRLLD